MKYCRFALMMCALTASTPVFAQSAVAGIPLDQALLYRVDFRNFFPSHDAEVGARRATYAMLAELESLRGSVGSSGENLLKALRLAEQVRAHFSRHIVYRQLMAAVDIRDTSSLRQATELQADIDAGVSFVAKEVSELDDRTLARYVSSVSALQSYAFVIEGIRRRASHLLAATNEAKDARELVTKNAALVRRFQRFVATIASAKIEMDSALVPIAQLANHPIEAVRERAWRQRMSAYRAERDSMAAVLIEMASSSNRHATARKFESGAAEQHFTLYLDTREVRSMYARLAAHGDLNKRYQRLIASRAATAGENAKLAAWNPASEAYSVRYSIDDARRHMIDALAPFSSAVQSLYATILDPHNGRMDIAPGSSRAPGAFAWGVPGLMRTFVYQSGFRGTYRDVTTLFHETTHAVHGELVGESPEVASREMGPPYLAEGIGMFFELLLNDQLRKSATDSLARVAIDEQFLWRTMLTFNLLRQAMVEQELYDGVRQNSIRNADHLDSINARIGRRLSIWYDIHPEVSGDWASTTQFVSTPLYLPNYVYASLLGLAMYERSHRNPSEFGARVEALMRAGINDTPANLLRRHLGIDLNDPKLIDSLMPMLESRLVQLERLR